jgi:asparagine synthetase B (glutamine-hydrolysing)
MVDTSRELNYSDLREEIEAEIQQDDVLNDEVDLLLEDSLENQMDLESEVGLEEVDLDEAAIDTIAADTTDDNLDADDDGVEDGDEDEVISNLPQEETESYGTGLQGAPSDRAGRRVGLNRSGEFNEAGPVLTGGDIDANYEQANAVGDESVGGTVATPDQDIVEELAAAVGIQTDDRSFLRTNDMLEQRDDRRWELDPMSSEDYTDRRE